MKCDKVNEIRFAKALLVVALAVGATLASLGYASATEGASGSYTARIWEDVSQGKVVGEALQQVGFVAVDGRDTPEWMGEVCDLSDFDEAVANADFSLVNLTYGGALSDAMAFMQRTLTDRGWTGVESGCEGVLTYIKEEGECRWVMIEAVEAGGATSVVLHIKRT